DLRSSPPAWPRPATIPQRLAPIVRALRGRREASAVQIDVLRPGELPASAIAAWRALQRAGGGWDSPFLSPCWARSVEQAQRERKGGGRDVRVAMLSEAGEPRAFMTAQVGRITALAAGGAMSDYEGLVGDPGPDFDVAAVVRALGVSRYDFSHVPAEQAAFK